MVDVPSHGATRRVARIGALLAERRGLVRDYLSALSGSAGRLVFSLIYFVALANALPLADFGLFATASAAGVMISRLLGLGFISALYRTATKRPNLIGVYTGGFLLTGLLSLPLVALASALAFWAFFNDLISPVVFAAIIASEVLLWRPVEAVMIVNNGAGRFGRAAVLNILTIAIRAVAALGFFFTGRHGLAEWSIWYMAGNFVCLVLAFGGFYPRQRLRFVPQLYWRKLADSVYVAAAEVLFYLQMEFDKLLVLSLGGPHLAGLYAIVMRLVDLTAIPVRTFNMMLVQKLMRAPELLNRLQVRAGIELGVFAVSTVAMLAFAIALHIFPNLLGENVAQAAPLLMFALLVPALRNLVEYQAELLYARGQTLIRTTNLALLAGIKALVLVLILGSTGEPSQMLLWLNAGFLLIYLVSSSLTYSALRRPANRV